MAEGLRRAENAARATRGLTPRKVHKRSNRGDFAACGAGAPSATVVVTDDGEEVTCKNCARVWRSILPADLAAELRESLYRKD